MVVGTYATSCVVKDKNVSIIVVVVGKKDGAVHVDYIVYIVYMLSFPQLHNAAAAQA